MVDRTNWNYPATRDGLLSRFIDKAKDPNYRQQTLYPLAEDVAQDFTPVVGEAKSAYQADQAFKNMGRTFRGGDYFSSAGYLGEGLTGLLGAVPVLGLGVTGVKKLTEPIAEQAPVFYSKLSNFFKDAPQKKAQGKQWQGMLEPQKSGVKSEEIEYTGIKSLLDENPDKVFTKEELQEVADSNRIQVEENVYGDSSVITKQEYEDQPEIHSVYRADDPDGTYAGVVGEIVEKRKGHFNPIIVYETNVPDLDRRWFESLEEAKKYIEKQTNLGTTTRHSNYQLKGGENYRELVLRLPQKEVASNYKITPEIVNGGTRYSIRNTETDELVKPWNSLSDAPESHYYRTEEEAHRALRDISTKEKPLFQQTGHFPDENPLLHVRFNDRTDADGGKQLFIEELQSDWAQRGREKGFRNTAEYDKKSKELAKKQAELLVRFRRLSEKAYPDKANKVKRIQDEITGEVYEYEEGIVDLGPNSRYKIIEKESPEVQTLLRQDIKSYDQLRSSGKDERGFNDWRENTLTADEMREASEINKQYSDISDQVQRHLDSERGKVANAPFVTSTDKWTDLGLRRMLRWAVDNNYDSIGWTTGVQQVNRYQTAFRQQVKSLNFGFVDESQDLMFVEVKSPNSSQTTDIAFEKDASGKYVTMNEYEGDIQPLEKVVGKDVAKKFYEGEYYFEGDDLTIGGEGFKESYDKIIPKRMKEIARKMGEKDVKIEKRMFDDGFSRQRKLMKEYKDRYNAFIPQMEEMAEEANIPLRDFFKTFPDHPATMLRERIDDFNDQLIKNLNKQMPKEKRTNWSMKITDKMREAIKKGLPLMAGAGITTGLLSQYQNQKNQNQSLLY